MAADGSASRSEKAPGYLHPQAEEFDASVVAALASGDPASFRCAVPVHQDGSCNGLQHYAALGGDEIADGLAADVARFRQDLDAAKQLVALGESKSNANLDSAELAAYTLTANVLLNLDEVVTRE